MSLSIHYLEYGHHVARLRRRRRRPRRACAPTSNTASHDNHEKINSLVSFCFHMGMGLRLVALRAAGAPLIYRFRSPLSYSPIRLTQIRLNFDLSFVDHCESLD